MPATIRVNSSTATVQDCEWQSTDPMLLMFLNALQDPMGLSPSIADPDLYLAQEAIANIGGELIAHTPEPYDPQMVY